MTLVQLSRHLTGSRKRLARVIEALGRSDERCDIHLPDAADIPVRWLIYTPFDLRTRQTELVVRMWGNRVVIHEALPGVVL